MAAIVAANSSMKKTESHPADSAPGVPFQATLTPLKLNRQSVSVNEIGGFPYSSVVRQIGSVDDNPLASRSQECPGLPGGFRSPARQQKMDLEPFRFSLPRHQRPALQPSKLPADHTVWGNPSIAMPGALPFAEFEALSQLWKTCREAGQCVRAILELRWGLSGRGAQLSPRNSVDSSGYCIDGLAG